MLPDNMFLQPKARRVAPSFYSQLYPSLKDNPAFMFDYALSPSMMQVTMRQVPILPNWVLP